MEKALSEVRAIMDELHSLRDINAADLDALGKNICKNIKKILKIKQFLIVFFF